MARTPAGAALTAAHYRGQEQIRAVALRDYMRLWPLWDGTRESFLALASATLPLVRVNHQLSSTLAASYFEAFRMAERVGGRANPVPADPIREQELVGTLIVTGNDMTEKAIRAGKSPQAAMQSALVRTSGTVTRFVMQGGRDALIQSTASDPATRGWARVTGGDPCAFCALVASQGPVFSEESASFESHDHCSCTAEPAYEGSEWPGRAREFRDLYNRAQAEARTAGELDRGTSNDALNAFRRAFAQ